MNQWLCDFFLQIVIGDFYNLKISFQYICMFSVSKNCTQRTYFPSNFRSSGRLLKRDRESWIQGMKAQCTESGQMYTQHPGMCGQVTKKCTFSRPKMTSRLDKQLQIFCCKRTDMADTFLYSLACIFSVCCKGTKTSS